MKPTLLLCAALLGASCAPRLHTEEVPPPAPGIFTFTGNVAGTGVNGTIELNEGAWIRSNYGQCRIPERDLEMQRARHPRFLVFECGITLSLQWETPSEVREYGSVRVPVKTETTRQGPCQRWEPPAQPGGTSTRCAEYQRLVETSTKWVDGQVRVVRQ